MIENDEEGAYLAFTDATSLRSLLMLVIDSQTRTEYSGPVDRQVLFPIYVMGARERVRAREGREGERS